MNKHQTGFTLVEMLVVAALFVFIGAAVLVLSQTGAKFWRATESQLTTLTNAQRALDRLRQELSAARQNGLTCSADHTTVSFNPLTGGLITYAVAMGNLTRTQGQGGVAQLMASGVVVSTRAQEEPFYCLANGIVQITLSVPNSALAPSPATNTLNTLRAQVWVRNPAPPAP